MRNPSIQSAIILATCSSVLLFSCADTLHPVSYYAYTPFPVNVPLLKKKNEMQVRAQWFGGLRDDESDKGKVRGGSLQAAYAVTNHIGITGSYSYSNEFEDYNMSSSYPETVSYKKNIAEIGAGYFTPVSKNKRLALEIYAGYGAGKNRLTNKQHLWGSETSYNGRIQRFYIQPALALHLPRNTSLAWTLRTSFVKFHNANTFYPDISLYEIEKSYIAFFEPSFVVRFPVGPFNWVKGNVQIGGAFKINDKNIHYRDALGSIGLTFLPQKKKK
ncbi:MAG: hypothetical protein QM802_12765 [Agriterribacter sp.]